MKCYSLFFFIFLGVLPFSLLAQENSTHHPSSMDNHSDDFNPSMQGELSNQHPESMRHDLDYHELFDKDFHPLSHETDSFETKFLNMLFVLGLLIGFMILASWALKRMMKSKITHLNTASSIKILETRYLSPRATVYLIEVQDRSFLIAESPTAVTYLGAFPPQEETTFSSSFNSKHNEE